MQKCPKCKRNKVAELIYGAPNEDDIPKIRQGLAIPVGVSCPRRGQYTNDGAPSAGIYGAKLKDEV